MDAPTDDALDVIEEEAAAVSLALGVDSPRLVQMLVERISTRLGGQIVYIAKRARDALTARNATICQEFNGRNYDELAKKHDITVRQVRKIVRTCPMPAPLGG